MDLSQIDEIAMANVKQPTPKARKRVMSTEQRAKRMQEGRERKAQEARKAKLREIIWRKRAERCGCRLHENMTDLQFRAKAKKSCTDPRWLCSTLDEVLRQVVNV